MFERLAMVELFPTKSFIVLGRYLSGHRLALSDDLHWYLLRKQLTKADPPCSDFGGRETAGGFLAAGFRLAGNGFPAGRVLINSNSPSSSNCTIPYSKMNFMAVITFQT